MVIWLKWLIEKIIILLQGVKIRQNNAILYEKQIRIVYFIFLDRVWVWIKSANTWNEAGIFG
ncbi:MAG: hypothetical protein A3H98_00770 [Bacteroidetes bacterium RIFCSPLOWO2_02_FULL_36_8]|nr:MAG: hypothetical protein A3H98_00770 [Bacteroidetes bacterium RIFCSPLOWO2_02_FULL_36_8]OFY70612.1 MAG: hypothetical protein A3G23_07735 [Bacteroidetes bacterium RIFCSPLOWO2_12_FULL_37_12]